MRRSTSSLTLALMLGSLPLLSGCQPASVLPEDLQVAQSRKGIAPLCVEGCLDPDPDPSAPGYFFPGTENQWMHCADGDHDADYDGLDDDCEYLLAHTFRPEMSFVYFENTNREPKWVAEWLDGDAGSKTVRIAYLPAYWIDTGDGGTSGMWCGYMPIGNPCIGHVGDSEFIRLDVKYNPTTKHWYLSDALYSAHTWHVNFTALPSGQLYVSTSSDGGGPQYSRNYMEYPDGKIGGYPRSWAADGKKANYPTEAYCDGPGGVGGADDCDFPRTYERLEVAVTSNLGSRAHPFINCIATGRTDHPSYGAGVQECFWSNTQGFTGWFGTNPPLGSGEAYGKHLADHFGF